MADQWHRRRRPDDVPTPVAVAVSDFCRRARAPAPAAVVRDALSLLGEDEDFRITTLTDAEPAATPLGPYAVVDLLRGTAPALAAERQKVGYYDLARALADARAHPLPAEAPPALTPAERATSPGAEPPNAEPQAQAQATAPERRKGAKDAKGAAAKAMTVEERIAPRRRERGERQLPAPRGRFAQLPSPRRDLEDLEEPGARSELEALVEQHRHRVALHKALGQHFHSRGRPPAEADIVDLLDRHGLRAPLEVKERELILGSYAEQRGAPGRVAWALDVSPAELARLTQELGLKEAVEEAKERFRREALGPRSLAARLDLLGRERYLAELGIKRRYLELTTAELRSLLLGSLSGATSLDELAEATARRHGTTAAVLRRAMDQLGLSTEFGKLVSRDAAPSSP